MFLGRFCFCPMLRFSDQCNRHETLIRACLPHFRANDCRRGRMGRAASLCGAGPVPGQAAPPPPCFAWSLPAGSPLLRSVLALRAFDPFERFTGPFDPPKGGPGVSPFAGLSSCHRHDVFAFGKPAAHPASQGRIRGRRRQRPVRKLARTAGRGTRRTTRPARRRGGPSGGPAPRATARRAGHNRPRARIASGGNPRW